MSDVHGTVAAGFEPVRQAFESQIDDGEHIGGAVAVYAGGKCVVDLWGGVADEASGRPWSDDTMALSYSTTKGLTATCLHLLADRGLVSYHDRVASFWPEFAQRGKADITVYHVLTHQAGIPQIPDEVTPEDVFDWDRMVHVVEELEPLWEPGTDTGYHALNFGWLVGELIRRVDGRPIKQFLQEEVCAPLGLTQMHIGAPPEAEPRIATLVSRMDVSPELRKMWEQFAGESSGSLTSRALSTRLQIDWNTPEAHHAQVPAANGIISARDLARMFACLANYGELDGVHLLSEMTVRTMSARQTFRPDKVIILPVGWALGYMTGAPGWPQGERVTAFGHAGFGGSIGFADPEIGMSFGMVTNTLTLGLTGAGRATVLADAARACIERKD
jgi:CubicO group peptidase (beta-lactamase class C family)